MTNEEVIEKLGYIKQQYNILLGTDIYDEVIDIAIQAVKTGEIYITGEDYNLYMRGYKAGKKDFEPKQGEWIANPLGDYVCNKCSWVVGKFERNFCPNCGTKMRKKEDCTSIVCGDCVLGNCDSCEDLRGDTE